METSRRLNTQRDGYTNLLHLPDELLDKILQELPNNELYALALISKRLHYVALPIYFANHGIMETRGSPLDRIILGGGSIDVMRAIRICLFVSSAEDVCYTFDQGGDLLRKIHGLYRLISTLSSVEEVTLDFWDSLWRSVKKRDVEMVASAIIKLLNAIVVKGCTKLILRNGTPYAGNALSYSPPSTGSIAHLRSLLQRRRHATLTSSADCGGSLSPVFKSFVLDSTVILHPLICDWVIRVLNSSPIESFSFGHKSLNCILFPRTLPLLNLHTAKEIAINGPITGPPSAQTDLCSFLCRHSQFTTLTLTSTTRLTFSPMPLLSSLATLHATADTIVKLLDCGAALPRLKHITILLYVPEFRSDLDQTFGKHAPRIINLLHSVVIYFEEPSFEWMRDSLPVDGTELSNAASTDRAAWTHHVKLLELSTAERNVIFYWSSPRASVGILTIWIQSHFPCLESVICRNGMYQLDSLFQDLHPL